MTSAGNSPSTPKRLKLTKAAIEHITPPATGYHLYWFEGVRGLGLRVTSQGVRSFILQQRIKGRERRKTIGRYPELTAVAARLKATKMLGEIASGGDPIASEKRAKLASTTLQEAFDAYLLHKDLKARTKEDMRRVLEEAFSDWKAKPITKITRAMVERRYRERSRKSIARANLAFRYLRAVFNLAAVRYRDSEDKSVLADNPVGILSEGKLWHKVNRRRTVLTPDDLKSWVPAVMTIADTPNREVGQGRHHQKLRHGEVYRDLLLFHVLTGCRRSEALAVCKSDVDLKKRCVTFRDTKNRNDHQLPLTPYLKALLERRITASPNKWIFVSPYTGKRLTNPRTTISRIFKVTGLKFTYHDLRRLAATSLERLRVPAYTIKAILNHAAEARDVTGGYIIVDAAMKLEALKTLEQFILGHVESSDNVMPLGRCRAA